MRRHACTDRNGDATQQYLLVSNINTYGCIHYHLPSISSLQPTITYNCNWKNISIYVSVPLCLTRADSGCTVGTRDYYLWDMRLEFSDSNAGMDNTFSEPTCYLSGYSRSISLNGWVLAEFDIPTPTSSLPDRELRTIDISDIYIS